MDEKYRTDKDLLDRIADLEKRLSRIERTNQLSNAAINNGDLAIKGGAVYVRRLNDSVAVEGLVTVGSSVVASGVEGMAVTVDRSKSVESGVFDAITGEALPGQRSMFVSTVEGEDSNTKFNTWALYDKSGYELVSDSLNARVGFNDPKLATTWHTETFNSTTSGSFVNIASAEWYMYHPNLRVRLLVQNDGGNVSELRLVERPALTNVLASFTTSSGLFDYVDLVVPRSATQFGANPNGNITYLAVEHRRVSGAGTVRAYIVSMIGIDLSWFNPY